MLHIPPCLLHVSCVSHIPTQSRLSPQQDQTPGRNHNIQVTVEYKNHFHFHLTIDYVLARTLDVWRVQKKRKIARGAA